MPQTKDPIFLKGYVVILEKSSKLPENGILIHSFTGDQILTLENPEVINQSDFVISLRNQQNSVLRNKADYLQDFKKVQNAISTENFQKLILSRIKEVKTNKPALEIFSKLNSIYPNTFNSIFSSPHTGTWIGATPELLLKSDKLEVETVSIAGTKIANGISEWTKKEYSEQQFVTEYILTVFQKNKLEQIKVSDRITLKAGPVEHLKTSIQGRLNDLNKLSNLLGDLHPTPATCGIPKEKSIQKIQEIEPHKRNFYTGYIGILNHSSNHYFVNLRCMELQNDRALLYVGGGITKESDGESEWLETERKAETLICVL